MNAATATTNGNRYVYSVFKKLVAPSEICLAMKSCFPSPTGALFTRDMSTATMRSAKTPPRNGTETTTRASTSESLNTPMTRDASTREELPRRRAPIITPPIIIRSDPSSGFKRNPWASGTI